MEYTDLLFLFALFPLTTIFSLLDRSGEYKNLVLIITSLLFFSWGRPFVVCVLFLSVITDWLLGFGAEKLRGKGGKSLAGLVPVLISGAINCFVIYYYNKNYLPAAIVGGVKTPLATYISSIGMVYYGLRGFSYVFDVYKGKAAAEKNFFCLMTYMLSYHFMCVGPLVRYGDIQSQIRNREITTEKLNAGLNCVFWGLGKIVLLSSLFGRIKQVGLSTEITTLGSWIGMLAFFAQHYFLFTGLCDISRGLCLTTGFLLPVNYKDIEPDGLFSGLVGGYNTTVVSFFKDILGINGNPEKGRLVIGSVLCTLMLGGFYAVKDRGGLCFITAFGAMALVIALEQLFLKDALEKLPAVLKYVYMLIPAMLIFSLLYFESFGAYKNWLVTLFGVNTKYTLSVAMKNILLNNLIVIIIAFFVFCLPAKNFVLGLTEKLGSLSRGWYGVVRGVKTFCTVTVFLISVVTLVVNATGV